MIALVIVLTVLLVLAFLRIHYHKTARETADRRIEALRDVNVSLVRREIAVMEKTVHTLSNEVQMADSFNASIGMEILSGTDVKNIRVTLVQGLTGIQFHVYTGGGISYLNGSFDGLWLSRKEPSWVPRPSRVVKP